MKFRTEIRLPNSQLRITHTQHILSMGSCFAVNMGEQLAKSKFDTCVNPLGITYNPVSLARLLQFGLTNAQPSLRYFPERGIWHSFDLHSEFSGINKDQVTKKTETGLSLLRRSLRQAKVLILTLGTAMVYQLRETGKIVSNCHKYPGHTFEKRLLEPDELQTVWQPLLSSLASQYPDLQILLTVSPVRHIKDTLSLNSVSKATLRLLCHQLEGAHNRVAYFPAYEIMVDDLRDYRYYTEDLLHPTPLAQQYIWEKLRKAHMSEETRTLIRQWQHIQQQLDHRPLQPETDSHRVFLKRLLIQLKDMNQKLPCDAELLEVIQQLESYNTQPS